jgi:MYXO-CTERM domain-containing protein
MKHEKLLRASAVAISLGLTCALPAAAQTSGGSSAGKSAQSSSSAKESSSAQGSSSSGSAGAGQTSPMDPNTRADSGDRDWGWLGLLGLIGLAGLRRRRDTDDHRFEGTTTRRPTV